VDNNTAEKRTSVTILQVAKAVIFAFMGIRKKSDLENDAATLKPAQLIVGGIIGGVLFVISIMLLVRLIVS
jgi:hypothetical protein